MSKVTISTEHKLKIGKQFKKRKQNLKFSIYGDVSALKKFKSGKACGTDQLFPEFFIHLGYSANRWLSQLLTNCFNEENIFNLWNKSENKAILKPGKSNDKVEHYRPIALLCICIKIFDRIIYNRIQIEIDKHIPIEQAGFRQGRNCCDQVVSLTSNVEAGFQDIKKTAVVFVDLSAAYDTVWIKGLLIKLCKIIKCKKTINIISALFSNRQFRVHLDDTESRWKNIAYGLPQGSVLAPILFNVCISDLVETNLRKYIYADDLAIAYQFGYKNDDIGPAESDINNDLFKLDEYYMSWRLRANPSKTQATLFNF